MRLVPSAAGAAAAGAEGATMPLGKIASSLVGAAAAVAELAGAGAWAWAAAEANVLASTSSNNFFISRIRTR